MAEERTSIELLKALLMREVDLFCRRADDEWKRPIASTLDDIRRNRWRAVFFGGTLRSLLLTRLAQHRPGRPRDVDIVVQGPPLDALRRMFEHFVSRETRFGGLQLRRADSLFDVWPLERTWALVQERVSRPDFDDLPRTTFLNIEAIAVEVWPSEGSRERRLFSGDDQFFRAVLRRVLDINREENPYPDLCVVRSLVMAHDTGFSLGGRLARYVANNGLRLSATLLEEVQQKHYGTLRVAGPTMAGWIRNIADALDRDSDPAAVHPIRAMVGPATESDWPDYLHVVRRWYCRKGSERPLIGALRDTPADTAGSDLTRTG